MRKKLFAIVMSMTMVASFMPSLAFATTAADEEGHQYYEFGANFTIVNGKPVTTVTGTEQQVATAQKEIDKHISNCVAPTHDSKGSYEAKCIGAECDETIVVEIPKTGCTSETKNQVRMSLAEYASAALAHNRVFENKEAADYYVKQHPEVCYVLVDRCNVCGDVTNPSEQGHALPATLNPTCSDKVACANTGCNAMIDATTHGSHTNHSFATTGTKTVACNDAVTITEKTCSTCGEKANELSLTPGKAVKCELKEIAVTKRDLAATGDYEVLYDGKVIAKHVSGNWTVEPGYQRNAAYSSPVFYKADTTVDYLDGNVVKTYYGYTCTKCGFVNLGTEVPATVPAAHTHTWTKITKDATCESAAKEAYKCDGCGTYKDVDSNATGNTFASVASTVTNSNPLGHKFTLKKVDGNCVTTAYYEVGCSTCGEDYAKDINHVTRVDFRGATEGSKKYLNPADGKLRASANDAKFGDFEIAYLAPAHKGHVYTKKVTLKKAACDKNAVEGYVCDVCGKKNLHSVSPIPGTALKHNYVETKTPATCGAYGTVSKVCSLCGDEIAVAKDETAKPLVKDGAKCTYDKWVVTKAATVFEEGVKTLTCSVCGDEHPITKTVIAKKTVAKASNTVKAGKKSFNVKSSAANATGYRVYYKKAGAKSWKSYTKKTDSLSKTFSKLSKGKYYVKVKAYAKNYAGDGEVVWGAYSATKTVKVK